MPRIVTDAQPKYGPLKPFGDCECKGCGSTARRECNECGNHFCLRHNEHAAHKDLPLTA